jgi:histidine triad (HIT) family protein
LVDKEGVVSSVYEDEKVMAFLDVKPVNEGHTLVIPKTHYENIYEIPDDEIAYLYRIVKRVAVAVKKGVNAEGISVSQHNERAAFQRVSHLHVHVIPRYEGDKLGMRARHVVQDIHEMSREKLDETARKIKAYIKHA